MSADAGGNERVIALRRPPIRQATLVRTDVERAFAAFVRTIGAWWPLRPYSSGKGRVRTVTIEERVGGRTFETWEDGTTVAWGTIVAWEPPSRFVLAWAMTPAPTEVEFRFTSLGPSLTRVAVEHRGWEALSDRQVAESCPLPYEGGPEGLGAFASGWARILACFAAFACSNEPSGTAHGMPLAPATTRTTDTRR